MFHLIWWQLPELQIDEIRDTELLDLTFEISSAVA